MLFVVLEGQCVSSVPVSFVDAAFPLADTKVLAVKGLGPKQALRELSQNLKSDEDRSAWREKGRVAAILGSCPHSHASVKSGCKSWVQYVYTAYGEQATKEHAFPPKLCDLLGWSNTFRCAGTFCNYLSYVRKMCQIMDVESPKPDDQSLRSAILAVHKRDQFTPRQKMFVSRCACCLTRLHTLYTIYLRRGTLLPTWSLEQRVRRKTSTSRCSSSSRTPFFCACRPRRVIERMSKDLCVHM